MHRYLLPALTLLVLAACGDGSGDLNNGGTTGGGGTPPPPSSSNVAPMTVEIGPAGQGFINLPFISITVCAPGSTTNCQTIDGIEVDTGSTGLRILSSALSSTLLQALPQQLYGSTTAPVAECEQFADGYSWGPVVSADVQVSGETASDIPVQVIGSPNFTQVPSDCSTPVPNEEDTLSTFGANGLIGLGVFAEDCGSLCASEVVSGTYYQCPTNGGGCTGITEGVQMQVVNPVTAFATDNNGVIIELENAAAGGATSVSGSLVFGIGTESNNAFGTATVLQTDPNLGTLDVTFGGTEYGASVLDTGSNAFYFTDSSLSQCAQDTDGYGFFCTAANLTATITTASNTQLTASFSIADATTMFQALPDAAAYPQLAGPIGSADATTFDFGLPYFYGRNVFVAIEGASAGGTTGPFFAY
jgi:hypothetical protein